MKKTAKNFVCATSLAVVFVAIAWGGERREYPVTLKVWRTNAISTKVDGSRITTTCTSASPVEVTCDSTEVSAAQHTELYSLADTSDGKLYLISCILGAGRSFLSGMGQSMQANAGLATISGCAVPPGTYKARWDKGRLKVLFEKNGKSKEITFEVLTSGPMPSPTPLKTGEGATSGTPEKTLVLFSSVPTGAEIQMDGGFVGHTPSSIPVPPGEHSITITKSGYKPWERKVRTVGGEVTIAAELDAEPK